MITTSWPIATKLLCRDGGRFSVDQRQLCTNIRGGHGRPGDYRTARTIFRFQSCKDDVEDDTIAGRGLGGSLGKGDVETGHRARCNRRRASGIERAIEGVRGRKGDGEARRKGVENERCLFITNYLNGSDFGGPAGRLTSKWRVR